LLLLLLLLLLFVEARGDNFTFARTTRPPSSRSDLLARPGRNTRVSCAALPLFSFASNTHQQETGVARAYLLLVAFLFLAKAKACFPRTGNSGTPL
jgi:hypothetical protein